MLKNRNSQIPNGLRFYCATLQWHSQPGASFRSICESYAMAVRANVAKCKAAGIPTDMSGIEARVDEFNSKICEQNGWHQYLQQGGAASPGQVPFAGRNSPPVSLSRTLANVAAGAETLVEWISSGSEAVPQDQANRRASICSACPLNSKGDWTRLFTKPVSEAITVQLQKRSNMGLSTPWDDSLRVCGACLCPLKLLVHVPLAVKLKHMSAEAHDALDKSCWILAEEKQLK